MRGTVALREEDREERAAVVLDADVTAAPAHRLADERQPEPAPARAAARPSS